MHASPASLPCCANIRSIAHVCSAGRTVGVLYVAILMYVTLGGQNLHHKEVMLSLLSFRTAAHVAIRRICGCGTYLCLPPTQSDSLVLSARTLDVAGMFMVTRVSITRKQAIYTVWKSTRNAFGTMRVIIMSTD